MKRFKTKLFSLLICLCLCLSIFTGCSLGSTKGDLDLEEKAFTIGTKTYTQQEVVDLYSNFYAQNSGYYPYYDDYQEIIDIFYKNLFLQEIIKEKANEVVVLSDDDVQDVLDSTYDYFASQIDSIEKAILSLNGIDVEEDEGYERLKSSSSEDTALKYEEYNAEDKKVEYINFDDVTPAGEVNIDNEIAKLKQNIARVYYTEEDDVRKENTIAEGQVEIRKQAFEKYLANLMFSAKVDGQTKSKDVVFAEQYKEVYDSYYESKIQERYQDYIESTTAGYTDGTTVVESKYSDEAIVKKYKALLNASYENNTLPENYVELLTSSDNDALILYHNETGSKVEDKYFSVQHILVEFDQETLDILKNTNGYSADSDLIYREYYEQVRALYAADGSKLTVSYRDENGKVVMDGDKEAKVTLSQIEDEIDAEIAKLGSGATEKEITMLFNRLSWKYSADEGSLKNNLSNRLGFTISNEEDNHGNWVKDFANGARQLYNDGASNVGDYVSVVTDYGVHIMMLTGVYEAGALVEVEGKTDQEIVNALKSSYVSNMSNQTLYEYIYDMLVDELVGSNGTFYSDYRNQLLIDYEEAGLLVKHNILTYDELDKAIKSK